MTGLRERLRSIVPNAALPSRIEFSESSPGTVVLGVSAASFICNMQDDSGAVDAWALVPLALGLADRVEIRLLEGEEPTSDPGHALRLRFRFDWLHKLADDRLWIDPRLLNWRRSLASVSQFVMNQASRPRSFGSPEPVKPTDENDLELRLAEPGGPLANAAHLSKLVRQVPVGVFAGTKSAGTALFPGGKAAIDLMGLDNTGTAWIFELKAQGNCKVGGLSELLFYTAVVQHVQGGDFKLPGGTATLLPGLAPDSPLRACLLAPDHHPLLKAKNGAILDLLNRWCAAAHDSKRLTVPCQFCLGKLDLTSPNTISVRV